MTQETVIFETLARFATSAKVGMLSSFLTCCRSYYQLYQIFLTGFIIAQKKNQKISYPP